MCLVVLLRINMCRVSQYHRTHETANNSTNNNIVFFFALNLKIVYYNNYHSSITMSWTREKKYFASQLFGDKIFQNCLKVD